ncbi:DUF6976 family protein [Alloyangia pacifica]|uniref:DUF6976 family protein n=1 Tax=Alloyangia pacifica TaxID=311180 RepID=UPI003F74E498
MSCNCILNFPYDPLETKRTGDFTDPVTFGEIAYILLNQTMVRLQLHRLKHAAVAGPPLSAPAISLRSGVRERRRSRR